MKFLKVNFLMNLRIFLIFFFELHFFKRNLRRKFRRKTAGEFLYNIRWKFPTKMFLLTSLAIIEQISWKTPEGTPGRISEETRGLDSRRIIWEISRKKSLEKPKENVQKNRWRNYRRNSWTWVLNGCLEESLEEFLMKSF